MLFDNNIFAAPEHFIKICAQIKKEKLVVDFNQGLDFRLLTEDLLETMKTIRHKAYRFALDNIAYIKNADKAISLLKKHGIKKCTWYVLVGFDSTFEEDLERLNFLRSHKQDVFVQRYNIKELGRKYTALARWANQHHLFVKMTWEDFMAHPDNKSYQNSLNSRAWNGDNN